MKRETQNRKESRRNYNDDEDDCDNADTKKNISAHRKCVQTIFECNSRTKRNGAQLSATKPETVRKR